MKTVIDSSDIEKAAIVRSEVGQQETTEINDNHDGTAYIVFEGKAAHDLFWQKAAGRGIAVVKQD